MTADVWLLDRFTRSWENLEICAELGRRGYSADIVDWEELSPSGGRDGVLRSGVPVDAPRVAVVKSRVITRRSSGELALLYDGLDALADAGTRVSNPVPALRRCRNKVRQAATLARAGLPVPPTRAIRTQDELEDCLAAWSEVVLKPVWGHASIDVHRLRPHGRLADPGSLLGIREEIVSWHLLEQHGMLCAQPYIDNPGRDLRITMIGAEVASAVFHVSTSPDGSVRHFLHPLRVEPAVLTPEVAGIATAALRCLDLDFAVIDLVEGPSGPVIIEVNEGLSTWSTIQGTELDLTAGGHTVAVADELERMLSESTTASSSVPAPDLTTSATGKPVASAARSTS
ncbi:MAG: tetrahydromethanopterin:alpha-L-glutamate ligase [Kribbellaceae bacterium]|jgi:glutathione synthase/RimK-type ligase-like ATP-grasp enzyme|nr:tetrahydromethanopterin:alpha-L-glutamate ligase [Kribbellaceae bacterium]